LHQSRIPAIFDEFKRFVGGKIWLDRAEVIGQRIFDNPLMGSHLYEQNRVVLSLAKCSAVAAKNKNILPWSVTEDFNLLETFVFMWRSVQLIHAAEKISNKRASILVARIREALREPHMLKAMQLEATVATHFVVAGCRVLFPELGSGKEKFDLLVEDLGSAGLEIECKLVPYNKGRKVHREEAREFLSRLMNVKLIRTLMSSINNGFAIRVTVPTRLSEVGFDYLLDETVRLLLTGRSGTLADGTVVRLFDFDRCEVEPLTDPPSKKTQETVRHLLGSTNSHYSICTPGNGDGGVLILAIDSARPDSMLHELFDTYAESAGRQLTGRRAAALMSTFEGLSKDQLSSISYEEGADGNYSALAWHASEFLERIEFPHVVGVGFISEPDYTSAATVSSGLAYWFPKKISPMWTDEFSGLFGLDPRRPSLITE
jgi:hypothetical protein